MNWITLKKKTFCYVSILWSWYYLFWKTKAKGSRLCFLFRLSGGLLPVSLSAAAASVGLSLTEPCDAAPSTVHWAAGEYHTCWTQFHLERNWRTSSHSHTENSNQISTQSGGTSATLHLTLKWGQVVLVDYRWLVVGWQRSEISPEIHLHLIASASPLTVLPLCPSVCHLLSLSLFEYRGLIQIWKSTFFLVTNMSLMKSQSLMEQQGISLKTKKEKDVCFIC